MLPAGVELVRYQDLTEGYVSMQFAIEGVLAPSIDDHKSSREKYKTEEEWLRHNAQFSETLIHLYGDARNPHTVEMVLEREQRGF